MISKIFKITILSIAATLLLACAGFVVTGCEDKTDTVEAAEHQHTEDSAASQAEPPLRTLQDVCDYLDSESNKSPNSSFDAHERLDYIIRQIDLENASFQIKAFAKTGRAWDGGLAPDSKIVDPLMRIYLTKMPYASKILDCTRILIDEGVVFVHGRVGDKEMTHLAAAASAGYLPIVKFLVEEGVDINNGGCVKSEENGKDVTNPSLTPLALACSEGHQDVALYLLEKGAALKTNIKQCNLLHVACKGKLPDLVKTFIQKGFDLNEEDENGMTPLAIACSQGDLISATALIDAGASVNVGAGLSSPLAQACKANNAALVTLLLNNGAKISDKKISLLHIAAYNSDSTIAQQLIAHGCNVNQRDENEMTPLIIAVSHGNFSLADTISNAGGKPSPRYLLKNYLVPYLCKQFENGSIGGVNRAAPPSFEGIKALEERGWLSLTAEDATLLLYRCIRSEDVRFISYFVQKGADINSTSSRVSNMEHPLIASASSDNVQLVQAVLDAGGDLNVTGSFGHTALHRAAVSESDNTMIVQLLLDKGCNINAEDEYGLTPLQCALEKGNYSIARHLISKGAKCIELGYNADNASNGSGVESALLSLCRSECTPDMALFETLLERGCSIQDIGTDRHTALDLAVDAGHKQLVKYLIDQGVDVNQNKTEGFWSLRSAITHGDPEMVEILLNAGCDVNAKDDEGITPLILAVQLEQLQISELLLTHSANVLEENKEGDSPLSFAVAHDDYYLTDLIAAKVKQENESNTEKTVSKAKSIALAKKMTNSFIALRKHFSFELEEMENNAYVEMCVWALPNACREHNYKMAEEALEQGCKGELSTFTPLAISVQESDFKLVKLFVEKGEDVNTVNELLDSTPLSDAIFTGNFRIFEYLLQHSAKVTSREAYAAVLDAPSNKNWLELLVNEGCDLKAPLPENPRRLTLNSGQTLLCVAVQSCSPDVINYILDYGLDIDAAQGDGKTALMVAAASGRKDIVELLLNRGANPRIIASGFKAEDLARINGHKDVVEILVQAR